MQWCWCGPHKTLTFVPGFVLSSGRGGHGHASVRRGPAVAQSLSPGAYSPVRGGPPVSSVGGHGCRHVGGGQGLVGLLLEALRPQVQQGVEGVGGRGRRGPRPRGGGQGVLVRVGGEQGLGGVAVRQRGQGQEGDGGRGVGAGERGLVVPGEGQGEVPAGGGGAAAEAPRPLEEPVLLLPLLVPEVLLVLEHLPTAGTC